MSSDYPGDQSSHYPPRQSHGPQQGHYQRSDYPDNQGYGDHPSTRGMSAASEPSGGDPSYLPPGGSPQPYSSSLSSGNSAAQQERRRWMIVAIAAALVLVVCGVVAGVVYAVGQNALQGPMNTASMFCNDLKAQKYSDAYGLLSPGYQGHVTAKVFTEISQLHDQLDGKVQQCGLAGFQGNGGFSLNVNPQSASLNAQITRRHTYTGVMSLVKQGGTWKIDAIDDSLQGSDVGALTTGAQFCQALASQDYSAVYGMFTPAYQQQIGSMDTYVSGLKQVFGGGQFQITGCDPKVDTYAVSAQGDGAAVSGALNIKVTTDAGALTVPVPFKLTFAKISGTWKISDLEVAQSQG